MNSFNTLVLQIAVVILIICLALIGWALYESTHGDKTKWPPVISNCPDYWKVSNVKMKGGDEIQEICTNNLKLGREVEENPSIGGFNTDMSVCNRFPSSLMRNRCTKLALARRCNITWDGITENSDLRQHCYEDANDD